MPRQEGQKSKLLALLRIFEMYTDENHLLNVPQLVEMLERQDIHCERKSIYSDIDALRTLGYDVVLKKGRNGGYWLAHRTFDIAELKLLVDAVQSSRFIPESKSKALIRKLEELASVYEAVQLQRQVYVDGRPRTNNNQLLYSVDALHGAIGMGRMVSFNYRKGNGYELRTVSPWRMAWDNGCYYLIAYQDEKTPAGIRHYRVDRMKGVQILDEPRRGAEQFKNFNLPAYLKMHFNMYGGPAAAVTLRCDCVLEEAMRERFGKEPVFLPEDDGKHFHFDTNVCVSEQFFGWVCGFGGKVEILSPSDVRAQLQQMAKKIADLNM